LKPIRNADRQRTLYLNRDQRRALLGKTEIEAEPFVRSLCLLPLRPGAVANLNVADFDKRTSGLSIGKDKSGKPRRILIPRAAVKLFTAQARNKEAWKHPIADAVIKAKLPAGTTAYTLRHSTITDLVNGGLPLLTVAQISDTSAEMIERHYGHLSRHAAVEALAERAL
jgi:integrase